MSQPVQYGSAPPAAAQRTDVMAVLGLVFAFVFSPLGIVFSILGLRNTRRDGTAGHGLALAGLIVSIVSVVLALLGFALLGLAASTVSTAP